MAGLNENDKERLSAYVDGELSAADMERVRAELVESSTAADYVDALSHQRQLLHEIPAPILPRSMANRVMDQINSSAERSSNRWRIRAPIGVTLAIAACLSMFFILNEILLKPATPEVQMAELQKQEPVLDTDFRGGDLGLENQAPEVLAPGAREPDHQAPGDQASDGQASKARDFEVQATPSEKAFSRAERPDATRANQEKPPGRSSPTGAARPPSASRQIESDGMETADRMSSSEDRMGIQADMGKSLGEEKDVRQAPVPGSGLVALKSGNPTGREPAQSESEAKQGRFRAVEEGLQFADRLLMIATLEQKLALMPAEEALNDHALDNEPLRIMIDTEDDLEKQERKLRSWAAVSGAAIVGADTPTEKNMAFDSDQDSLLYFGRSTSESGAASREILVRVDQAQLSGLLALFESRNGGLRRASFAGLRISVHDDLLFDGRQPPTSGSESATDPSRKLVEAAEEIDPMAGVIVGQFVEAFSGSGDPDPKEDDSDEKAAAKDSKKTNQRARGLVARRMAKLKEAEEPQASGESMVLGTELREVEGQEPVQAEHTAGSGTDNPEAERLGTMKSDLDDDTAEKIFITIVIEFRTRSEP